MSSNQIENKSPALFKDSSFKWLISGAALSMLGDQFTLIALPWLVLKMTGDTFALGIVLALTGVPRALFMLIGGALVDRYSAKQVLMLTKYINTVLLGLLAFLVLSNNLSLWMVYALSLAIGLATAFSIPSGSAILPQVVNAERLPAANGMMLGLRQVTMFAGPLLAGLLIALFSDKNAVRAADTQGIGAAFLLDALSFVISAFTLAKVRMHWTPASADPAKQSRLLESVAENLRYCWSDIALRTCFFYWAAIALFISGPIQVALPVLANTMNNGAAAFGILMGAHGAGTLVGMIISGVRPNIRVGSLGMTILAVDGMIGLLTVPMGMIHVTWAGAAIMLLIGALGGFVQVAVYTWMQRRVPDFRMGRTMSLFMFIFMGIAPISAAFTGWLMRSVTVGELFAGSGMFLFMIALTALVATPMRMVSDMPLRS